MVIGPDFTQRVNEQDWAETDALLIQAFGRADEAELVKQLRKDGDIWSESVKRWNGVIGGYVALSRMRKPDGWACLAPLAVLPQFQNAAAAPDQSLKKYYSFGTRLASEIADMVKSSREATSNERKIPDTVVVLGKPSFYERAGFSSIRAQKLISPYPVKFTLIARPGDDVPQEVIVYPPAFDEFE
jgi:putative acetyltransferase